MDTIVGLNTKTMEEKEFKNIAEAQKYVGNRGTVKRCLDNKIKSTKGWLFRYKDKEFPSKATEITDKRIKVYVIEKEGKEIKLPLEMIRNIYNISKSEIITASKGYSTRNQGLIAKRETAKGYTIREATKEEQEEVLSSISYVDYLKTINNKEDLSYKLSVGEGIIKTILDFNDVFYIREKEIEGLKLRMDFYVEHEGKKYCIEHHGQQHYREWGMTTLDYKKSNDQKKKEYCDNNGIELIVVKYSDTIEKTYNTLEKYNIVSSKPRLFTFYKGIEMDIIDFENKYQYMDKYQLGKHYDISPSSVSNIASMIGKKLKRK